MPGAYGNSRCRNGEGRHSRRPNAPAARRARETVGRCRLWAPGQVILSPDDPPDRIHIIKKGKVRVYRVTPDGKQLTLDIYEKATILGDMRLLGQDRVAEAYAKAIDAAVICTITPDELRRLVERYPIIGVNIITFLSRRFQEAERELEAMAYQRVGQRLARKLLDLGQRFGVEPFRGTLMLVIASGSVDDAGRSARCRDDSCR